MFATLAKAIKFLLKNPGHHQKLRRKKLRVKKLRVKKLRVKRLLLRLVTIRRIFNRQEQSSLAI